MDKHRTERISIRINGKEKYFLSDEELNQEISAAKEIEEKQLEVERMSLEPISVEEMVEGENSFKDNVIDFEERLEVKRNGHKRMHEKVLKGRNPFSTEKNHTYMLTKKKKRQPIIIGNNPQTALIKKLIFVLLSAVVIGIGFGYVLLSLFTDISEEQVAGNNVYTGENGQAASENNLKGIGAEAGQAGRTTGAAVISNIAPLKLEIIQGGAFESEESANQFASQLKDRGAAAVIMPKSNPVLMFIGLGTNRNELEGLGQYYLDLGQEIYIKSFNLSGIDGAKVGSKKVTEYVSTGLNIYQSFVTLSTNAFQQNKLEKSALDSVATNFSEWNKSKPSQLPTSLEQLSSSLSKAYQALASYQKKPDQQQLWNSQQALLEGLVSYKNWHDEKTAQ